jgi:hypothetical protein
MMKLLTLLLSLVIVSLSIIPQDIPWPFTIIQDSPFGRLYSVGISSSSPAEGSNVNISFYLDPLREGFRFSPALDVKTNSTELNSVSKWGPDYYTLFSPCPVGMTCIVCCAYPSSSVLSGQSVLINITSILHRQAENAWVIALKLPVNSKIANER